jgi:hypothetical protein
MVYPPLPGSLGGLALHELRCGCQDQRLPAVLQGKSDVPTGCPCAANQRAEDGSTYLLTMVDRTTSWSEDVPLRSMEAAACAEAFIGPWVARYGQCCGKNLFRIPDLRSRIPNPYFRELSDNFLGKKL